MLINVNFHVHKENKEGLFFFNGNTGLVGPNKYFLFLEMIFKNMKVNIINKLNNNPKLYSH